MSDKSGALGIGAEQRHSVLADVDFYRSVLNALSAHIAVVDSYGTIIAVNAAWRRFGESNGLRDPDFCVGANYFAVCRSARDPAARQAYAGIHDVLSGVSRAFEFVYPCHSPDEQRWFVLRATLMTNYTGFAVIAHEDVTGRLLAEQKLALGEAPDGD